MNAETWRHIAVEWLFHGIDISGFRALPGVNKGNALVELKEALRFGEGPWRSRVDRTAEIAERAFGPFGEITITDAKE